MNGGLEQKQQKQKQKEIEKERKTKWLIEFPDLMFTLSVFLSP